MEYIAPPRDPSKLQRSLRRMLRSRVRRSFTVEIKSKSRQAASWPELAAAEPVNWAALDPGPETHRPVTPESAAPESAATAAAEKPRRILPSLLAPEPEPEAPPVVEREPPLPRVRRIKVRPAPTPVRTSSTTWSFADLHAAEDDSAVPETHPAAPPASQPQPQPVVAPVVRSPKRMRLSEPSLRPGERWKRRLPRSCR